MGKGRLIFLIILDAVRFDHLSIYGYSRSTSPGLEKFLKDSIIFKNAHSTSSWTPPAHASMVTGQYPHRHGVFGNNIKLPENLSVLAEILQNKGFLSLGLSLTPYLSFKTGYNRGFSEFIELWNDIPSWGRFISLRSRLFNLLNGTDNRTFEKIHLIRKWLAQTPDSRDRFVFVNFIAAHNPYHPPRAWRKKFIPESGEKINQGVVKDISGTGGYSYLSSNRFVSEKEWDLIKLNYDREIAYLDYRLSQLFESMKADKIFDSSEIFILSDHGEVFGEHHLSYHGFGLFEPLIRIPLIYKPAGTQNLAESGQPVSVIDILPTILNRLHISHHLPGYDLSECSSIPDDRPLIFEFGIPEALFDSVRKRNPDADLKKFYYNFIGVKQNNCKLILKYKGDKTHEYFFNLQNDPGETVNLIEENIPEKRELRMILDKVKSSRESFQTESQTGIQDLNEDGLRDRLKDLGYL